LALDQNGFGIRSGKITTALLSFVTTVVTVLIPLMMGLLLVLGECGTLENLHNPFRDTTFCGPGSVRLVTSTESVLNISGLKEWRILPGETFLIFYHKSGSYAVIVTRVVSIDNNTKLFAVKVRNCPSID